MLWAKTQSAAKFNLATSGVASFPLHELPVTLDQLEINGDSAYGYAPLQQAIAKKCGVDPDCVVAAAGTSMANHLAMAALIDPGDEVLLEQPPMSCSLPRSCTWEQRSSGSLEARRADTPWILRRSVAISARKQN